MENIPEIKDSGKRQEFTTGSVRDTDEGKGQPHLLPTEAIYNWKTRKADRYQQNQYLELIENNLFCYAIASDNREDTIEFLYTAIDYTIEYIKSITDGTYGTVMKKLAIHFQNGAKKYAANNWRKGQPISRMYDSAKRHLWAVIDGKKDEPHEAALLWNLFAILQTKLDIKNGNLPETLNDFPFIKSEIWVKENNIKLCRYFPEKGETPICEMGADVSGSSACSEKDEKLCSWFHQTKRE